MKRHHLATIAIASFVVITCISTTGAQAEVIEPSLGFGSEAPPPMSPVSRLNAVRAAQNYVSVMPFSRQGLIQQLVGFEGYSADDATYAVDNITVDWSEQAAKAARNYLDLMPFSRSGLIEQLTSFDGYTYSQAVYGVATTGL